MNETETPLRWYVDGEVVFQITPTELKQHLADFEDLKARVDRLENPITEARTLEVALTPEQRLQQRKDALREGRRPE